jgi:hypothetical protein
MEEVKFYCDKCKKEMGYLDFKVTVMDYIKDKEKEYDLCKKCFKEIKNSLEGK